MRIARWLQVLIPLLLAIYTVAADNSRKNISGETSAVQSKIAARATAENLPVKESDDPSGFTRWPQLAALSSSNRFLYYFGASVAIDGDTIVVGAENGGYAAVFVKPAGGWHDMTEIAMLIPSGQPCDFGTSVSISGDTIVVGQPQLQFCNTTLGAAYVFVKPAGGWKGTITPVAVLTASDGVQNDGLGSSVSIDGNTIVAGAPNFYAHLPGAAYVFVEPVGGWSNMTQTAKLSASDGVNEDQFGTGISISGRTVIAGAPNAPVGGNNGQGAAYLFVEPANGWMNMTQTAKLTASDGATGDGLGFSVAVDRQVAVAGAPFTASGGAGYAFLEPPSGWVNSVQTAKLTAKNGYSQDELGAAVAISDNRILMGAPWYQSDASYCYFCREGAVYAFERPPAGWGNITQTARLTASDARYFSFFGSSVSASRGLVVGGAKLSTTLKRTNGGAYIFIAP